MLGIGGRTISQARQNLSADEVATWAAYRAKRGTLSLGLRLEQLFAISDARAAQMAGAKGVNLPELLRYHDAPEDVEYEPPAGAEVDAIVSLFGLAKKT